jgi:hypothetical protein
MSKKQNLLIITVLALLTMGTGVAYAGDDQPPAGHGAAGRIGAIDLSADTFALETMRQGELAIRVTESTEFRSRAGDIEGIEDLEAGMPVVVAGQLGADGELTADVVGLRRPAVRPARFQVRGQITSVDVSDQTFTLKDPAGREFEIRVGERTRFVSRDDSITGIDDLQVGMLAQVQGLRGLAGRLDALRVAAGSAEGRPHIRPIGEITDIGDDSFTMNTRQGRSLTLLVDEMTRYRSRDGSVNSFKDLKVGITVAVAADEMSDGTYKAIVVGVGARRAEPSPVPQSPQSAGPAA